MVGMRIPLSMRSANERTCILVSFRSFWKAETDRSASWGHCYAYWTTNKYTNLRISIEGAWMFLTTSGKRRCMSAPLHIWATIFFIASHLSNSESELRLRRRSLMFGAVAKKSASPATNERALLITPPAEFTYYLAFSVANTACYTKVERLIFFLTVVCLQINKCNLVQNAIW